MWQWRPLTSISFWHLETPWLRIMLHAIAFSGFGLVLYSTFIIDHFDLFGLRQVWLYYRGKTYTHPPFMQRSVYKYIRHPLMTGFLIGFWATPDMTLGHLLFAAVCTGYILVGVMIEERDLVRFIGNDYTEYRKTTPAYIPFTKRSSTNASVVNEDSIDPKPAE